MTNREDLILRLRSGVPIVEVAGEWSTALAEAVTHMLASLQRAGHFEIVLNVQRAGIAGLQTLTSEARAFRSHHGHLDVVGTVDQIEELVRSGLAGCFRLAPSEDAALRQIKGIPVLATGTCTTARIDD